MPIETPSRLGACKRCHERKARCDKSHPTCSSCSKAGKTCIYVPRETPTRRQDVDRLEARLRHLEATNASLSEELRRTHQQNAIATTSQTPIRPSENSNGVETGHSNNNEVASQVSYLSLSAGGDRPFLGSASGLLLADLLHSNFSSGQSGTAQMTGPSGAMPVQHNVSRGTLTSLDQTPIPTEKIAQQLLAAYCDHDHLCYPFLDVRLLHEAVHDIYADETSYASHPIEGFFFDMVCAIGTAFVYKFDWLVLPEAETHYNRAMTRFHAVLAQGGVVALQAILSVCQYRMSSSSYDTSASLWLLIGIAARICLELGLHKESSYSLKPEANNMSLAAHLEIKRRCFWSVVAMDRVASLTLGRPMALHLDDIDTELPQFTVSPDIVYNSARLSSERPDSPQWQLRSAIFVFIVRYRLICGEILQYLHSSAKRTNVDIVHVRSNLAAKLSGWLQDLSQLPLLPNDAGTADAEAISCFRVGLWYELLYHNGVLMLYRPSPALSDISQNSQTVQHIFHSAQQSMNAYANLHRSRKINYSWVTLHAVFIAGLSYIYALRCHFQNLWKASSSDQQSTQLNMTPTISQVVNDTRACSNVLVAVSERWSSARSCSQVFDKLSDAILADVVAAEIHIAGKPQNNIDQGTPSSLWPLSPATSTAPQNQQGMPAGSSFRPMAVDTTMQNCFGDLREMWTDQCGGDAIYQLSQDWMYEIPDMITSF